MAISATLSVRRSFLASTGALVVMLVSAYLIVGEQWLILVLTTGVGAVLALRPSTTLLFVFAFLPFQSLISDVFAHQIPVVAVFKDILMIAVLCSFLIYQLATERRWHSNATIRLIMVFAAMCVIYSLAAPSWLRAILQLRPFTLYPFIVILVANGLNSREELRRVLYVVALVGMITVAYGLLQYHYLFDVPYRISRGEFSLTQRMSRFSETGIISTFATRPDFGGYLIPLFLLLLQVRLWRASSFGLFRTVALGAVMLCLVLTYSRTSWMALLVGLSVILYLRGKLKATVYLLGLTACFFWFYETQLPQLSPALAEATTSGLSLQERFDFWPRAIRLAMTRPFGAGLGTVGGPHIFEPTAGEAYDFDPMAGGRSSDIVLSVTDNSFLKLFVQGGLPLLLVFLFLMGATFELARDACRSAADPWLRDVAIWSSASFASLLTIFMFVDFMESVPSISVYWLAIGALCCVKKLSSVRGESGLRPQVVTHQS
ncbi:MAG: O-antigen ligase family protein [Acidobacteria bacterium]|nr:O-antigen ligase family protein [Acidobacteriota bacterium]MCI0719221.1 O-antigen ligase family protein [Acidobacteriota bacterium]